MKINLSAHNIAITSFAVIAITSWSGLAKLPKTEKVNLTSHEWVLIITGSLSTISGFCLAKKEPDDGTLADEKPDSLAEVSKNLRGSRSNDSHFQTHAFLNTLFDESITKEVETIAQQLSTIDELPARGTGVNTEITSLDEQEQRAKKNMLAMLSDLDTDTDPVEALQGAVRLCSDKQFWIEPARYGTRYQDTERFYIEDKLWPIIRNNQILWDLHPDNPPPDDENVFDEDEYEPKIEQTPFRPFRCCPQCKYIGEYHRSCAVVPFGCGTGDPSKQCREFERKNGGTESTELKWVDAPY